MALFALADPHLSHRSNKPMDMFGDHWVDHVPRMAQAWDALVRPEDVVLCPGDISWALRLDEAMDDLAWLGQRPGTKVLCRGNHDYWWTSISKVRAAIPDSCRALQNDAVDLGEYVVCGSRLWAAPGALDFEPKDQKIYEREVGRLKLSLEAARKVAGGRKLVVMVHYPPFTARGQHTDFSRLICQSGATLCVYGHLHGARAHATAVEGVVDGVAFHLVACDRLGFVPKALAP
ncbi:MAG: metallophosphoesterase [Deltaproteobacteria bacterium]|nr:metallophosphoesterase [Deltaproteobacteria bacterium]